MSLEHHPLLNELPEHKDKIHELKLENAHFRKLFDEYHEVDKKVYRIESGEELASNEITEDLKKIRLSLKDELYSMIVS